MTDPLNRNVVAAIAGAWAGLIILVTVYFDYRGLVHQNQVSYLSFILMLLMGVPFIAVLFGPEFIGVIKNGMLDEKEMRKFVSASAVRFFCFLGCTLAVYALGAIILQLVLN